MLPSGAWGVRAVFHRDLGDDDVQQALATVAAVLDERLVEQSR
jgi:hypothetical protein